MLLDLPVAVTFQRMNGRCREITARQDAVQELCSGTCAGLLRLREMLARCPDLEKGLCSIYHSKVWGT